MDDPEIMQAISMKKSFSTEDIPDDTDQSENSDPDTAYVSIYIVLIDVYQDMYLILSFYSKLSCITGKDVTICIIS